MHIIKGFVNHLFWDGLVPLLGRERALLWPKKLKLIQKSYRGEIFEENACRKLLKEASKLHDDEIHKTVGYFAIVPFITAFTALDKIVRDNFSVKNQENNLDKNMDELVRASQSIDVSETLKIYVLTKHLKQCLYVLGNDGLRLWSEQAVVEFSSRHT